MIKKIIVFFFIVFSFSTFSQTYWKGENKKITIIYKVLDPLIIDIEPTERLYISKLDKNFKYSQKSTTRNGILVKVETPYNTSSYDEILRKIYEKVYFQLENEGVFDLVHENNTMYKIKGSAYFVDENVKEKATEYSKEFASSVAGSSFNTTTRIDVDFSLPDTELPLGIYKGTLRLNVWFGGTINWGG